MDPVATPAPQPEATAFSVSVEGFEGPFDLLLSLISKHKLEVTVLALHTVTDDFITHVRAQGDDWNLDETTEFLVVAAVLLDLKAARLLPGDEEEDEEDLALLEARDVLFARLLQYRAFKDASAFLAGRLQAVPRRTARTTGLDPHLTRLMPEVVIGTTPARFRELAVAALTPAPPPEVNVDHVHSAPVSVQDQAAQVVRLLREHGSVAFTDLVAECPDTQHVIARFLALLDLYRQRAVRFGQSAPLAPLTVEWTGSTAGPVAVNAEFDETQSRQEAQ